MTLSTILILLGCTMFILVGLLHTYVHFNQLVSPFVKEKLKATGNINVGKSKASVWKLWQGMSLLFGLFMIFIGAISIASLIPIDQGTNPTSVIIAINMLLCIVIIYSGFKFFSRMQIYGGVLCFLIMGFSFYFSF